MTWLTRLIGHGRLTPTDDTFDRRLIAPVILGSILNPVNSSMIAVALIPIGIDLGAPPSETAAWLVSALYLATAIGQPAVGRLVDIYGPRRLYLAGAALVGIAGILGALAASVGALVVTDRGRSRLIPMFAIGVVVSAATGRRAEVQGKLVVGAAAQIVACAGLLLLGPGSGIWWLLGIALILGLPQGLNTLANQNAMHHQADPTRTGSSAGLYRTFFHLGAISAAAANGAFLSDRADTPGQHLPISTSRGLSATDSGRFSADSLRR